MYGAVPYGLTFFIRKYLYRATSWYMTYFCMEQFFLTFLHALFHHVNLKYIFLYHVRWCRYRNRRASIVYFDIGNTVYIVSFYIDRICINYRIYQYKKLQYRLTTMGVLPLFKSCLISALDNRNYLQEKWIGDHSLATILQEDYGIKFANKR